MAQPKLIMSLVGIFALLALLLSAVGVYAVMAISVSQRIPEIGIRMALGARRADVLNLVLREGMRLTLAGLGLGLAGAIGLTHLLRTLLFGISPTDPLTLSAVALLLVGVSLLACYLPARRATKIDPLVALRCE